MTHDVPCCLLCETASKEAQTTSSGSNMSREHRCLCCIREVTYRYQPLRGVVWCLGRAPKVYLLFIPFDSSVFSNCTSGSDFPDLVRGSNSERQCAVGFRLSLVLFPKHWDAAKDLPTVGCPRRAIGTTWPSQVIKTACRRAQTEQVSPGSMP